MKRIPILIFILWVSIWIFFTVRTMIKDNMLEKYFKLIGKSLQERRAIVYGKDLLYFLDYCLENLPKYSTYKLIGLDYDSVDYVRAIYYLYPHLITSEPSFILVFQKKDYSQDGYLIWLKLNEQNFILKRK